ncbi:MAG: hypothetical protein RLZZ200_1117 [Pseudomonadota bacterium]|jgi:hypothetical protein
MPQPFNYSSNIPDPTQNLIAAVTTGQGIQQLKAAQVATKTAEASLKQQQQLQADLSALSANASPAAVASMMVKYPSLSEHFKRTYDVLGSEQQKAHLNQASEVYAALSAGDNDTAQNVLRSNAEAYTNSGMKKEAKTLTDLAELIKLHPETAKTSVGLFLASAMGPEKFIETFTKLESERRERDLEPSKLTTAQATAREAATRANFAESNAVIDLQKKGWDIWKIQEDAKIARENNRIAALNAAAARETNDLKRQELQDKLKDAQMARDQKVRDTAASIEAQRGTIDNSLSVIDRVLKNPSLNDVLGSLEGGWLGAAKNILDDESQDAIAGIETLGSQVFIEQIRKAKEAGATFGALSEKEGERLMTSLQSLSRKQSEKQFTSNLQEVQRLMLKSRKSLADKYGMPDTIPDTPNAAPSADEIDAILKKHGG